MSVWKEIIENGDIEAVRKLIASGADVNATNKDDKTDTVSVTAKDGEIVYEYTYMDEC